MSGALGLLLGASGTGQIVVGATAATHTTGSSVTVSKPAGVAAGDLLIAICMSSSSTTWTGDSGWTEVADYGSSVALRVAWKIATGAEPSSYAFTSAGIIGQTGLIIAIRNAAFDVAGSFDHETGANLVMPGVTLSRDGLLLAICIVNNDHRDLTTPSDMVVLASDNANSPSYAVFSQTVGAGATGTRTSDPGPGSSTGILIGIKGA